MIDTLSLKKMIIDNATSGILSSYQSGDGKVDSIISELPKPSAKRKKLLEQTFEYDEKYTIPQHWRWVRLGEISTYGDSPQKVMPSNMHDNMWILELEDIEAGGRLLEKKRFPERMPAGEKTEFTKGQILYSKLRPYLKKVLIADEEGASTPELIAFDVFGGINVKYITYCLVNSYVDRIINKRSYGVKMPRVDSGFMANLPIPLPSLEEQERIVNIVEKSFEQIDIINDLQAKYSNDLAVLKSKIIDAGIQGKLTEQLPEDGDAEDLYVQILNQKSQLIKEGKIKKEKPLPDIAADEIPFEIPKNWKWVRFGNLMWNRDSERIPVSVADRKKLAKTYDYYGASGVIDKVEEYLFDEKLLLIGEDGANLLSRSTPIAFLAEGKYWVNNHAHVLGYYKYDYLDFVMYYINSISLVPYVTGAAQPKLNQENMNKIPVPLPPYSEQKRISSKLKELLELIS